MFDLILQRLQVAYVNKERAAQHQENRLLRQMENDKEQAIADKVLHGKVFSRRSLARVVFSPVSIVAKTDSGYSQQFSCTIV